MTVSFMSSSDQRATATDTRGSYTSMDISVMVLKMTQTVQTPLVCFVISAIIECAKNIDYRQRQKDNKTPHLTEISASTALKRTVNSNVVE